MNFILTILSAINLSAQINIENYVGKNILASHEIKHYEEAAEISKKTYIYSLYETYLPKAEYNFYSTIYSSDKKSFSLEKNYSSSQLIISQNLFNNFNDSINLKTSFLLYKISLNDLWLLKQEISFKSINVYIDYLKATKMLEVSKASEQSYIEEYEKTKNYYNEGLKSYSDLLKSELNMKTAQLYTISRQNYLKNSLMDLNSLYYEDPLKDEKISDIKFEENIELPDENKSIETALENRKEIYNLKKELEIKENSLRKAKIFSYPYLKLDLSYTKNNIFDISYIKGSDSRLFLSLNYDFGPSALVSKSNEIFAKKVELEQLKRKLIEEEISIKKEVISSILSLSYSIKRYEVSKIKAKISAENLKIIKEKYAQSKVSIIDLIDAQKDELDAQTELAQSYYDLYLSFMSYKKAIGEKLWKGD